MLVRDVPNPVQALEDTILVTCSQLISSGASTSPTGMQSLKGTGDAGISTGDIGDVNNSSQGGQISSGGVASFNGRVIDRLRQPLGSHYQAISVQATMHSSVGSSEADRKLCLGALLQHGDSSGGGDMAEYSTGSRARERVYFTSARTTDVAAWDTAESSGPLYIVSNPGVYDLRNCKRYIRVQVRAGKNSVTTETSGDEQCRVGAIATFLAGDLVAPALDTASPFSTSTTT